MYLIYILFSFPFLLGVSCKFLYSYLILLIDQSLNHLLDICLCMGCITVIQNKEQYIGYVKQSRMFWQEEQRMEGTRMDLAPPTIVLPQQTFRLVDESINEVEPKPPPRRVERERGAYSYKYSHIRCSQTPVERYHVHYRLISFHSVIWFLIVTSVAACVDW